MDKIHHIAIQVEDIARSVEWYKKNYEVEVSYQDETWAMIDFANTSLALVLAEQHPPYDRNRRCLNIWRINKV